MQNSPARSGIDVGSVIAETYTIEALIGRGGMGAVFLASHKRLPGKKVAIKLLHAELSGDEVLARFKREAEIASRLAHPNIVGVHDYNVTPDGTPYVVLDYLEGAPLSAHLKDGPLPLERINSIVRQVASALAAAHREGIVHRDLKPQNIFLVPGESEGRAVDVAKVLDFGISKIRGSDTVKTQDSTLLGTPQYMAPEQATGQHDKVDERTDLFALGAIVHEMLSGQPAFSGANIPEVVFKVVYEQPAPLPAGTPPRVVAAVERAMAKKQDDRFPDVGAFVEALTGQPLPVTRNPSIPPTGGRTPSRNTGKEAFDQTVGSGDHGPTALPPSVKTGERAREIITNAPTLGPDSTPPAVGPDSKPSTVGPESKPPTRGPESKPPTRGPESKPSTVGAESKPPTAGRERTSPTPGTQNAAADPAKSRAPRIALVAGGLAIAAGIAFFVVGRRGSHEDATLKAPVAAVDEKPEPVAVEPSANTAAANTAPTNAAPTTGTPATTAATNTAAANTAPMNAAPTNTAATNTAPASTVATNTVATNTAPASTVATNTAATNAAPASTAATNSATTNTAAANTAATNTAATNATPTSTATPPAPPKHGVEPPKPPAKHVDEADDTTPESPDDETPTRLAGAEAALASRDYARAEQLANAVINGEHRKPGPLARAHVVHGIVECAAHNDRGLALADLRAISAPRLRKKLVEGCQAVGMTLDQ